MSLMCTEAFPFYALFNVLQVLCDTQILRSDTGVPVMWRGNNENQVYPRSTRNVSLQTLGFRLGLNLEKNKITREMFYENHMATNSLRMSGMSLVNSDSHCNLKPLWAKGNRIKAL